MFHWTWLFDAFGNLHICEIITLVVGLLGIVAYKIYSNKFEHKIEVTRNIPSPPAWPIIGHGHYFMFKKPHEMFKIIRELADKYAKNKKCIKIWLGTELNIITIDLKDVEIILGGVQHLEKAGEYNALGIWLGDGLLVSHGRKWHQRRKIITPAFHFSILTEFTDIFEKESHSLLKNLDKSYQRQTEAGFDLGELINLCTLDAVCGK